MEIEFVQRGFEEDLDCGGKLALPAAVTHVRPLKVSSVKQLVLAIVRIPHERSAAYVSFMSGCDLQRIRNRVDVPTDNTTPHRRALTNELRKRDKGKFANRDNRTRLKTVQIIGLNEGELR